MVYVRTVPGKVFTKSKRKPGGGPVAMLSSLMSSVVEEMTSSPTSSQSSVTSTDDVLAPGDDETDATTDYVFRIVYMSRPEYVGELRGCLRSFYYCPLFYCCSFYNSGSWLLFKMLYVDSSRLCMSGLSLCDLYLYYSILGSQFSNKYLLTYLLTYFALEMHR